MSPKQPILSLTTAQELFMICHRKDASDLPHVANTNFMSPKQPICTLSTAQELCIFCQQVLRSEDRFSSPQSSQSEPHHCTTAFREVQIQVIKVNAFV